jgi:hypothetical protein
VEQEEGAEREEAAKQQQQQQEGEGEWEAGRAACSQHPLPTAAAAAAAAASTLLDDYEDDDDDADDSALDESAAPTPPPHFLAACKGDAEKAQRRWDATRRWRRAEGIDRLLFRPNTTMELVRKHYPLFLHGRGRQGEVVMFEMAGAWGAHPGGPGGWLVDWFGWVWV